MLIYMCFKTSGFRGYNASSLEVPIEVTKYSWYYINHKTFCWNDSDMIILPNNVLHERQLS